MDTFNIETTIRFTARAQAVTTKTFLPSPVVAHLPAWIPGDYVRLAEFADCWFVLQERQFDIQGPTAARVILLLDLVAHPQPTLV